ncbi:vinculin isoform X7 [Lepeophtheirus salmonis]|uniref:vinculin isoform X7 n=1 Tax=Lepeophtheirus salmonis TaxID=72036 RepID=UPI003AF33378
MEHVPSLFHFHSECIRAWVSRLVIIHEEGEAGHEMPDLVRPVQAVSKAVHNLVKVGREMVISSDDAILKQDMPQALSKVENAAHLLEDAASISQLDPLSKLARSKLIEGSRLILQGTSNVLMVFDESEVRKIVRECKKVLDYLSVAEVIESMEDLVQFVKDLSPCLSKVTFDVEKRIEDLTHQVHRECLSKCVEQVKTLAPILICSMKIFIQILVNGGKGTDEAGENRNYLAGRMSEEVSEIVRVLQLTTYDEDEWDSDNLTVMRKTQAAIESKIQNSRDWIRDPSSSGGGSSSSSSLGEKSSKLILELANKIADRSLPGDAEHIRKLSGDIRSMTDSLSELRTSGEGGTLQAEILARNIDSRLNELSTTISQAINRVEKSGIQQPAPTISGKLEQARRWLEQPGVDDRGLGQHAINLILDEARKIAELLPPNQRDSVRSLCIETEDDIRDLKDLCTSGYAGSSRAQNLARQIATRLDAIKDAILSVLVERVVKDFMDVGYPLKKLTDCVQNPVGASLDRDRIFIEKSDKLSLSSDNIGRTAKMVALGNDSGNKKLAEGLLAAASQVESLTPQLINAGRICMVYPENAAAKEHFENLRKQYIETNDRARALCDDAVDSRDFVAKSLSAMEADARRCETCVRDSNSLGLVEEAMNIARLANRVFQVAHQEAENSEEPAFISTLNISAEKLQSRLQIMLQSAKALALNLTNESAIKDWRKQSQALLESVKGVQGAISYSDSHSLPTYPNMSGLHIKGKQKGGEARDSFVTPSYPQRAPPVLTSPFRDQKRAHLEKKQPDFTDEELSDIFQINFNEIFGSPDAAIAQSSPYKGITLPDKGRESDPNAPPRPPLPSDDDYYNGHHLNGTQNRPVNFDTTDDESEDFFLSAPTPSQGPIMLAAHDLHQEVRQWSSKDNDIIAAAKKMAHLMAKLSQLVGEDSGSKRELITCAKSIAEASDDVTRIAKELAKECTDKRMRTNLLQVCERIPTIATQLKILSTVKATMLGVQSNRGTCEDMEATEMLVGNAQNLMQSVKHTVTVAEAASIKIRTDAGIRLKWVRKQPWYQY